MGMYRLQWDAHRAGHAHGPAALAARPTVEDAGGQEATRYLFAARHGLNATFIQCLSAGDIMRPDERPTEPLWTADEVTAAISHYQRVNVERFERIAADLEAEIESPDPDEGPEAIEGLRAALVDANRHLRHAEREVGYLQSTRRYILCGRPIDYNEGIGQCDECDAAAPYHLSHCPSQAPAALVEGPAEAPATDPSHAHICLCGVSWYCDHADAPPCYPDGADCPACLTRVPVAINPGDRRTPSQPQYPYGWDIAAGRYANTEAYNPDAPARAPRPLVELSALAGQPRTARRPKPAPAGQLALLAILEPGTIVDADGIPWSQAPLI